MEPIELTRKQLFDILNTNSTRILVNGEEFEISREYWHKLCMVAGIRREYPDDCVHKEE